MREEGGKEIKEKVDRRQHWYASVMSFENRDPLKNNNQCALLCKTSHFTCSRSSFNILKRNASVSLSRNLN